MSAARGDMENRIKEQFSLFHRSGEYRDERANQDAAVSVSHRLCPGQWVG